MRTKENKGVTLIALAVTIIVMLILAGGIVSTLTGNSGITSNARLSKIMNELSKYKEEVELYKANKIVENEGFLGESLFAGKDSINYNIKSDEEIGNIKSIIPNITDEYINILQIIKGELLIKSKDKKQIKAAQLVGIQVNPYDITDDGELLSSNGNLLLMDETGTLTLPDTILKIGYGAFSGVEGLKTIIIPGSVKEIAENAFSNNKTLETVILNEGIEIIGGSAFSQCDNLVNVQLPSTIKKIKNNAFYYCINLKNINIPLGVEEISAYTFCGCRKLEKIIIPEGVECLNYASFTDCPNLSNIKLPSTLLKIDTRAFSNCISLNDIELTNNETFKIENGMLLSKNTSDIIFIFPNYIKQKDNFEIPEGTKYFNISLAKYINLKKIKIPSTLKELNASLLPSSIEEVELNLNNDVLENDKENKIVYMKKTNELCMCYSKEKTINIKEGIVALNAYSFNQATSAEYIILPDSINYIKNQAFTNVNTVKEIKIGKNVSKIEPCFKYWNYNGIVTIDSENQNYMIEDNTLYTKDKKTLVRVLKNIHETYSVKKGVEVIGESAFMVQSNINRIVIPDTVKEIKNNAFSYCVNIDEIEIPNSVNSLEMSLFVDCRKLNKVTLKKKEQFIQNAPWGAPKGMKIVNWI